MGNLVPGLLSFPFAATGLLLWRPEDPFRPLPLGLLVAFPVFGWVSLALFGLWGNSSMRSELGQRFGRERGQATGPMFFVGLSNPGYRSLIDPHEDIALLIFGKDELEIYGEKERFFVPRESDLVFRLKANTHSWIGLGGWVQIESPKRSFFVESRQNDILFLNRLQRKRLLAALEQWRTTGAISG